MIQAEIEPRSRVVAINMTNSNRAIRFALGSAIAAFCLMQSQAAWSQTPSPADTAAANTTPQTGSATNCNTVNSFTEFLQYCTSPAAVANVLWVNNRADSASIVNNVVRITANQNTAYGLAAQFALPHLQLYLDSKSQFSIGPFVGASISSNGSTITSAHAGLMFIDHNTNTPDITVSIGASITPGVQILGDGFVPNQAPPPGETSVRYQTTTGYGAMFSVGLIFHPAK